MVNSSPTTCTEYIEELCPGDHLKPGLFYDDNSRFCLISGIDLLTFDSETGQRLEIKRHSNTIVGVHFHGGLLVSLTDASEIFIWETKSEKPRLKRSVQIPNGYRMGWSYELNADIYILVTSCEMNEGNPKKDSLLLKFALDQLFNECFPQGVAPSPVVFRRVAFTGRRPLSRRQIDIGKGFYVKCQGNRLTMANFDDEDAATDSNGHEGADGRRKRRRLSYQFTLNTRFQVEDQCLVEFDSVKIIGDSLFATLNVGRIYCWSQFETSGLSTSNSSHVTLTGHRVVTQFSDRGTMFMSTGNGLLLKYNIAAVSGAGRWHKLEQLSLECPIRSMVLSADSTLLLLIQSDNGVCIVRSAGLCLSGKAEVVKKPAVRSVGIVHDPLFPRCLVTNSRIGCLQWVDPLRWKTTCEVDISEENVPPEDTFNRPDFLWLDVYLVNLSIPRIVTCEHRRNDLEKTYLKFWHRSSCDPGHLHIEHCVVVPQRVSFVRSTLDQCWDCSAVTVPMANGQEFLIIFSDGEMEVYTRDENRTPTWQKDLKRRHQNWQQFSPKHCSAIANGSRKFAIVYSLADNSHVSVWNLSTLSVVQLLDKLVSPEQAEWSTPSVLTIVCQFGIVSFDSNANAFVWAVQRPDMSISANHLTTFAHNGHFVYILNALNGTTPNDPLHFSALQKEVVALGEEGNVWFIGVDERDALSVLKPDLPNNKFIRSSYSAESTMPKSTAFSHLMAMADGGNAMEGGERRINGDTNHSVVLLETPSIKQFVDGPAHSLPPITQLARQFVRACLAGKSAT